GLSMVTTKQRVVGHYRMSGGESSQPLNCITVETPEAFRGQRIVGGNVALDLLNTQNGPAGGPPEDDVLADYGDFVAWAAHLGVSTAAEGQRLRRLAGQRPADAEATFQRARETRAYLRDVFDAVARGTGPGPDDLSQLRRDAADAYAHG